MKHGLLNALCCTACQAPLAIQAYRDEGERVLDGIALCQPCDRAIPLANGLLLHEEARSAQNLGPDWLEASKASWFESAERYQAFLQEKAKRGITDRYALFQPFNESSRALLAVAELLREVLEPGDIILDTWCRTGWSGEWLASLFPEQEVIGLWEGNRDVLGYSGFNYWLGDGRSRDNLSICFSHPDKPLPLASGSVKLIVGLDSLHRYEQQAFYAECRRLNAPGGAMFFPHIHLTNSEPEPWFDRGCFQAHGRHYRALLDSSLANTDQRGWVLSEQALFECGERFTLGDDHDTPHYNGAVLIGPVEWEGKTVPTLHPCPVNPRSRLILNPLVNADLATSQCAIADDHIAEHIRSRHPMYDQLLHKVVGTELTELERKIIYLGKLGLDLQDIALRLGADLDTVITSTASLTSREILFAAQVSPAMADLQHFYAHLQTRPRLYNTFAELWAEVPARYADKPLIIAEEGSEFDWGTVELLVNASRCWLEKHTTQGDSVIIQQQICPEALLVVWACLLSGRTVVLVDPEMQSEQTKAIMVKTKPSACFGPTSLDPTAIDFDSTADDSSGRLFSDIIGEHLEQTPPAYPVIEPDRTAFILFTSGSTGIPKGVELSQLGFLHNSAWLNHYLGWHGGDRALILKSIHSITGVRNSAIMPLMKGMGICLPTPGMLLPQRIFELCDHFDISVISTVPSQLSIWLSLKDKLRPLPRRLRQIHTSGYPLSSTVRSQTQDWLKCAVADIYGLTETCGFLLGSLDMGAVEGDLENAGNCLTQVVDEAGATLPRGEIGELLAYSPAVMKGYLAGTGPDISPITEQGWFCTNDLARYKPDGSIELMGRRDNRMKTRYGSVLYPSELEQCGRAIEGVKDAICLGDSSESQHDKVFLFLTTDLLGAPRRALAEGIYPHLQRHMQKEKLPDNIYLLDTLPVLNSGKPDKIRLIAMTRQESIDGGIVL